MERPAAGISGVLPSPVPEGGPPPLSVIVPSPGHWDHIEKVVEGLVPAIDQFGIQVIAVCGGSGEYRGTGDPRVSWIDIAEPNVFTARAVGVTHARSEHIVLLEDHLVVEPGWAPALIRSWAANPDADALVLPIRVGDSTGPWEQALFTLTFGPFLGATEVSKHRLPVPGNVAFRRSTLPSEQPADGWLEYDLLGRLLADNRIAMADVPAVLHVQPVRFNASRLSFHSGRVFASSRFDDPMARRTGELRRFGRESIVIIRQTVGARLRVNHGRIGWQFALASATLVLHNFTGQLVGIATRRAGPSIAALG